MAVTYSSALKSARMQKVIDAVDAGSGPGTLEITDSGGTVLASVTLQDPSFTLTGSKITLAGVPLNTTASATGTAAFVRIKDSDANIVVSNLTVSTTSGDFIVGSTSFASGQSVVVVSGEGNHS